MKDDLNNEIDNELEQDEAEAYQGDTRRVPKTTCGITIFKGVRVVAPNHIIGFVQVAKERPGETPQDFCQKNLQSILKGIFFLQDADAFRRPDDDRANPRYRRAPLDGFKVEWCDVVNGKSVLVAVNGSSIAGLQKADLADLFDSTKSLNKYRGKFGSQDWIEKVEARNRASKGNQLG